MKIQSHPNLTIHLLRRCVFGPERFDCATRWDRVRPSCPPRVPAAPPCAALPREAGWPYDSALPVGLPRLHDGDTLTTRSDANALPPIRPDLPRYNQPGIASNSSTRLDTFA